MSDPYRKALFCETLDPNRLQRIQSDHPVIWDDFKLYAETRGFWRVALRMLIIEQRSFAETATFIGYRLPDD
jgi:hypothetical protein